MISSRHPTRAAKAFTLVELLVVIGIIALLISILLPSLSRARESAKEVKCLSNMRQLGTATGFFVADHDGYLYKASFNDEPNPYGERGKWGYKPPMWTWDFVMLGYVDENKEVFHCPSDRSGPFVNPRIPSDQNWSIRGEDTNPPWPAGGPDSDVPGDADDIPASYRYNASNQIRGPFHALRLTQVEHSTQAILLAEGFPSNFHHIATWEWFAPEGVELGNVSQSNISNVPLLRHRTPRLNYMFYDGHAEGKRWEDTWVSLDAAFPYVGNNAKPGGATDKLVTPTPWRTVFPSGTDDAWQDTDQYDPNFDFRSLDYTTE